MSKAQIDKFLFYGAIAAGGLLLLTVVQKGVAGAVKDITSGLVGGVFDATGGILAGAYEALPEPIKPSSENNIFYRGINEAVQALPGSSEDETLGTWLYNITHPNEQF